MSRTYAFAIGALATFFLGLNLWPSRPQQHVATVRLRPAGNVERDGPVVTGALLSDVLASSGERADPAAVKRFQAERLRIEEPRGARQSAGMDAHERIIRVQATSHDQARLLGTGMAERLAGAPRGQHAPWQPVGAVENAELEAARRDEEAARRRLDSFVERQLQSPLHAVTPGGPDNPPTVPPDDVTFRPVSRRLIQPVKTDSDVNPKWQELDDELQVARTQRERLMERYTPLHPEVIALDARIRELERRRNATPRSLADPPPASAPSQVPLASDGDPDHTADVPPAAPRGDVILLDRQEWRQAVEEYAVLRRAYGEASQRRAAVEASPRLSGAGANGRFELAGPVRVTALRDGGVSLWQVLLLVVMSMSIGGATSLAVAGRSHSGTATISEAANLEKMLGLPVVGELYLDDPPPAAPPVGGSRWSGWLVVACEVVLGGLALGFLGVALADSPYVHEVLRRPLDGLSQIGARLIDLLA